MLDEPHTSHDKRYEVVFAADNRYAMPTTVAVRSLLEHLRDLNRWHITILDAGISRARRTLMQDSWREFGISIDFLRVPSKLLSGLHVRSDYITSAAYLRLLAPELIASSERLLYLDADVVVLRDLEPLFDIDLKGRCVGAVREWYTPQVSDRNGVENWVELGLARDVPYFNSGLIMIDIIRWRQLQIGERAIQFVRLYAPKQMDQAALNAVLAGDWMELERWWNFTTYWDRDVATGAIQLSKVHILHFLGHGKPWLPGKCPFWKRRVFAYYWSRTTWSRVMSIPG